MFSGELSVKKNIYVLLLCSFLCAGQASAQSLVGAIVSAGEGTTVSPVARYLQEQEAQAEKALNAGDFKNAYSLYSGLLKAEPENIAINLGYARSALKLERYGHAIMAYERILSAYPDEAVLQKELAYTYFLYGNSERALEELNKISGSSQRENEQLLKAWQGEVEATQISGFLSSGLMYDSNVNAGPENESFNFGLFNLFIPDADEEGSLSAYMGAKLALSHRLSQDSAWSFIGDANANVRYNFNSELKDRHLSSSEYFALTAGLRHQSAKSLFELKLKGQVFDYSLYQNVASLGPEANFIYAIHPKVHLISMLGLDVRDYSKSSDYNGWYLSAGQYARVFLGEQGHYVTFGGRYLGGYTEEDYNSYNGYELHLGFSLALPHNILLSPYVSFSEEFYRDPASFLENEDRKDKVLRLGAQLEIPLNDAWSVELGYHYTDNQSNSDLYTYDQHVTSLGVKWDF